MRLLSVFLVLATPLAARADNFPFVVKGPVISGVTSTDAWVAWGTSHHEGTGSQCTIEANTPFIGNHNTDVPTLALTPAVAGNPFSDAECSREHRVHLTGLSPATHYRFTLDKPFANGSGSGGEFTTATTDPDARFDFVVYGDNRDAPATSSSTRADHQAVSDGIIAREADAAFLLQTGDLALNLPAVSGDDRGYTEFFDVERGLLSTKPIFAVIGNHETIDTSEYDSLVNPLVFSGSPHPYYGSFEWGSAHVAMLDAFEGAPTLGGLGGRAAGVSDEQVAWLDGDLAAAQAAGKLLFVVTHQSPFSHPDPSETSGHGGSQPMQDRVLPLLLKYRALAVFGGHDHYYQRGHEGCVDWFVVGGGGAPMYEPDHAAAGVAVAVKATSYLVVSVDGARATAVAKSASGSILDTFTFVPADGTTCGVPPVVDVPDAGTPVDAGVPDAGSTAPSDAGPVDAGAFVDAGHGGDGFDAGAATPDAGHPVAPPISAHADGCQCGSATLPSMFVLAGLLALARRRRATHPRG